MLTSDSFQGRFWHREELGQRPPSPPPRVLVRPQLVLGQGGGPPPRGPLRPLPRPGQRLPAAAGRRTAGHLKIMPLIHSELVVTCNVLILL